MTATGSIGSGTVIIAKILEWRLNADEAITAPVIGPKRYTQRNLECLTRGSYA